MGRSAERDRAIRILASPAYGNRAANPYNALLTASIERAGGEVQEFSVRALLTGRWDIWHLHWPEHSLHQDGVLRALKALLSRCSRILIARATRTHIVWTVHNAQPHDLPFPRTYRVLRRVLVLALSGWFSLSSEAHDEAVHAIPPLARRPSWVIPHGDYRSCYPPPPPREEARRELGIDPEARVLLFFGLIRGYKDVPQLVRTFQGSDDPHLWLIIAGKPVGSLGEELRALAGSDDRIRLDLEFIPDERLPLYFAAADLTVLPFRRILNSGSALLSLSLDTPVLVPALGSMHQLADWVGEPWVHLFEGRLDTADVSHALTAATAARGHAPLEAFAWDEIGEQTLAAYSYLLDGATSEPGTDGRLGHRSNASDVA
jgi:beta-1,4-mannosyltransferase